MNVSLASVGAVDLLQRITRALAFAGSVLAGSLALSSTPAETSASTVTAPGWGWALTVNTEPQPSRASVERVRFELQRAKKTLEALAADDTESTRTYLSALDNLLYRYESAGRFVEWEDQFLANVHEQVWATLFRSSGPTSGPIACAAIESHPISPRLVDADALAPVLAQDVELVRLVYESLTHAHEVFGGDASFALEPFVDPESPHGASRVFLVVKTSLDVERGSSRMDLLDEWWLDHSHRASGLLSLAIDYV